MRLISEGNQRYVSEDGRVMVELDSTFETECDEPHPVRMRMDALRAAYSRDEHGQRAFDKFVHNTKVFGGREITKLTKEGWVTYLTWHCDGGEVHNYSMWTSQVDNEWTDIVTDKFNETVGELEKLLGEEIKVVHPRKPKAKVRETVIVNDRARWAACGHPAELDINEQCYVCHQDV